MKIQELDTSGYRPTSGQPSARITYCKPCGYLMRAGWVAQEILAAFGDEIADLALVPGTKGVFDIVIGDSVVWSKNAEGGFPELNDLKEKIRATLDAAASQN